MEKKDIKKALDKFVIDDDELIDDEDGIDRFLETLE